jgi:hypothetical protein
MVTVAPVPTSEGQQLPPGHNPAGSHGGEDAHVSVMDDPHAKPPGGTVAEKLNPP